MTHAIRIYEAGGAEQFRFEEVDVGDPGPGQVRISQTAVGLNFIDVYMRSGLYPIAEFPAVIGMEAAGKVEAVGSGVDSFEAGVIALPMAWCPGPTQNPASLQLRNCSNYQTILMAILPRP